MYTLIELIHFQGRQIRGMNYTFRGGNYTFRGGGGGGGGAIKGMDTLL